MKKFALEEAFTIEGVEQYTPQVLRVPEFTMMRSDLVNFTDRRLKAMDEGGIELAVLSSTTPGVQGITDASLEVEFAQRINDYVAEAMVPNASRFRAFAALPMNKPENAIKELRRAVKDLKFVGAMINGYNDVGGQEAVYYDAPQYLDFWKAVEELDVPVYIHPRLLGLDRTPTYKPYPELYGASWGFHVETGEHILRLMMSCLFDKCPNLKIMIGHLGEILPFWSWRIDHRFDVEGRNEQAAKEGRPRKLTITEYLQRNIYVTTSGFFHTPAFMHALTVMGPDHVLYSVDFPYESNEAAGNWFDSLDLPQDVKEKVAFGNAKKILKI